MKSQKLMPPTIWLFAIMAMIALHFALPLACVISYPYNLSGIVLAGVGCVMNIAGSNTFRRVHTTIRPFEESSVLVTTGLYRISRNPIYLGFALALLGLAILLGSVTPFGMVAIFTLLIDRQFITVEERMLERRFGAAYVQYKHAMRRWI